MSNFAGQWLHLRNLRNVLPNSRRFPDFDDNLRQAFQRETELFFDSILHEDRSVLDLLTADYTFVNERLARHYGIPDIYGSQFRRVTLTDESRQRLAGAGQHPGGDVACRAHVAGGARQMDSGKSSGHARRLRLRPTCRRSRRIKTARKPSPCASRWWSIAPTRSARSCHKTMDPIGFALENFDAVGAWRTRDAGQPVDVAGELADGTKVNGVVELRKAIVEPSGECSPAVTEKLMTYALGRGLDYRDMPAMRAIVREAAHDNYRISQLSSGQWSDSTPFQMRTAMGGQAVRIDIHSKETCSRRILRGARLHRAAISGRDDSGVHAAGQGRRAPSMRFGVVYFPNGAIMQQFTPKTVGADFEFTPILKPLEPFKDSLAVVTNLTRSHPGSQVGDHAVSCAGFLTGVWPKRTEAEDVLANTTIDQIVAQQIGQDTPLPSLELATEDFTGYVGGVLAGLQLLLHEYDFLEHADHAAAHGDQSARGLRADLRRARAARPNAWRRLAKQRSILDSIAEDARDLQRTLGARDRARVERLSRQRPRDRAPHPAHGIAAARPRPSLDAPVGVPDSFDEHVGADVRSGRGRVPGGRHPRVHVHDVARAEPADLSADRRRPSSITPFRITRTTPRRWPRW